TSPGASERGPRRSLSSNSLAKDIDAESWTVIDPATLDSPLTPSLTRRIQAAESIDISSPLRQASSERCKRVVFDTPTVQTALHPRPISTSPDSPLASPLAYQAQSAESINIHSPSRGFSRITPPQDLSPSSSTSYQDPGSPTKQAFSTTLEHPTPKVHASHHPPLTSEQPGSSANLTHHLSGRGSIETGLLPDGLTAQYTADISKDTQPDSPPSAADSEQSASIYPTQDVVTEDPSLTSHHSAEDAEGLRVAFEAGRRHTANKLKRTRSCSSSHSEDMSGPASPAWVKERLEQHNMFQDHGHSLNSFPSFKAAVHQIISRDRNSAVSQKEFEDFKNELEVYQNQNEDTLLAMLLPAIIKQDRTVQVPSKKYPEEAVWGSVRFFNSGIVTIVNREYQKGYVPHRQGVRFVDTDLVASMKKLKDQGMQNPKPDRAYGMRRDKYQFPPTFQMPQEIRDYLEILPDLHLPFMIIEGKAEGGSSQEACNQACRGGAALINDHRLLREFLGFKENIGPDDQTIVFSATYAGGLLEVWVHWAEVRTGLPPLYHMSLVASKSLREAATFRQARMILHNILDWGCGGRFNGLDSLYQKIIAYAKGQRKQEESSKSGAAEKTAEGREKKNEGGEEEGGKHKRQNTMLPHRVTTCAVDDEASKESSGALHSWSWRQRKSLLRYPEAFL
ncbi:MAG: hypothetical protein Q9210_007305, partial [Variospora velana]